jgi:hypothetical protein
LCMKKAGKLPAYLKAPVAQRIEHQTSNLGVAGSSPAGRAKYSNELDQFPPEWKSSEVRREVR